MAGGPIDRRTDGMGAEGIGGSLGFGGGSEKVNKMAVGQKLKLWPPCINQPMPLAENGRRTVGDQLGVGNGRRDLKEEGMSFL